MVLVLGLVASALTSVVPVARGAKPEELLAKLRAIPLEQNVHDWNFGNEFYDMHGNAIEPLQELMGQRFDATGPICRELEKPDLARPYARALYDVLAFVKDPAVIPWLQRQLPNDSSGIARASLIGGRWETPLYGVGHDEAKWLEQPERWAAFFRALIQDSRTEVERLPLERILAGWFNDRTTIEFFVALEKKASAESEELLCAQLYLRQHRVTYDRKKTKTALEALGTSANGRKLLLRYADQLRDPLFIPWLIGLVEPAEKRVEVGSAQWILEEITFRRDITGRNGWKKWWEEHSQENRQEWIATALADIKRLAKTDAQAAHAALKEAVYRWKDLEALPGMRELVGPPELADDLVGWINLSYHEYRRQELEALAAEVIKMNRAALKPWAIDLLKRLDFIPPQQSWADYVASSNLNL